MGNNGIPQLHFLTTPRMESGIPSTRGFQIFLLMTVVAVSSRFRGSLRRLHPPQDPHQAWCTLLQVRTSRRKLFNSLPFVQSSGFISFLRISLSLWLDSFFSGPCSPLFFKVLPLRAQKGPSANNVRVLAGKGTCSRRRRGIHHNSLDFAAKSGLLADASRQAVPARSVASTAASSGGSAKVSSRCAHVLPLGRL